METCIVETGLLRKKPCGHAAITKCANCEAPLCAQHAIPQLSAAQKKTGAFMCKECDAARRQYDKLQAAAPKTPQPKPQAAAPAKPPAAPAKAAPPAASQPTPDTIEYRPEPKKK